jgi:hypothetical protein
VKIGVEGMPDSYIPDDDEPVTLTLTAAEWAACRAAVAKAGAASTVQEKRGYGIYCPVCGEPPVFTNRLGGHICRHDHEFKSEDAIIR